MKLLVSLAAAAFVFPLTIHPDSVANCADTSWQFQTVSNTAEYLAGASFARDEHCRVVDRQIELYF